MTRCERAELFRSSGAIAALQDQSPPRLIGGSGAGFVRGRARGRVRRVVPGRRSVPGQACAGRAPDRAGVRVRARVGRRIGTGVRRGVRPGVGCGIGTGVRRRVRARVWCRISTGIRVRRLDDQARAVRVVLARDHAHHRVGLRGEHHADGAAADERARVEREARVGGDGVDTVDGGARVVRRASPGDRALVPAVVGQAVQLDRAPVGRREHPERRAGDRLALRDVDVEAQVRVAGLSRMLASAEAPAVSEVGRRQVRPRVAVGLRGERVAGGEPGARQREGERKRCQERAGTSAGARPRGAQLGEGGHRRSFPRARGARLELVSPALTTQCAGGHRTTR